MGETNFRKWEIPRSGLKAKDGEKKKRRGRLNDGDNNGQATHGARKPPGPKEKKRGGGETERLYFMSTHVICVFE